MIASLAFWISYVLLWLVALVALGGVIVITRADGRRDLMSKSGRGAQGPSVGAALPESLPVDIEGLPVRLAGQRDRPQVLLFASPTCGPCRTAVRALGEELATAGDRPDVVLIGAYTDEIELRSWDTTLPREVRVIPDPDGQLFSAHKLLTTPFAVAVGSNGRVIRKSPVGKDWTWLAALE